MSDELPTTIPAALDRAVDLWGDREALVDGNDVRWTWSELSEQVDVAARAMLASGVEHGDRVIVRMLLAAPGTDVGAAAIDGTTALDVATSTGREALVELLAQHGAEPNVRGSNEGL